MAGCGSNRHAPRTGGAGGRGRADRRRPGGDRAAFDELVRRTYVDTYTLAAGSPATRRTRATWCRRRTSEPGRASGASAATRSSRRGCTASPRTRRRRTCSKRRRHRTEPLDDDRRAGRRPARGPARGGGRVGRRARPHRRRRSTSCRRSCGRVVVLKDVYGLPHEAIAEELGISVAAAKVRLHRGRRQAARRAVRGRRSSPCGVTRSPSCCPSCVDGDRRVEPRGRSATSSRACAARPSWPATGSCCATLEHAAHPLPRADARACSATTLAALAEAASAGASASCSGPPPRLRRRDRRGRGRRGRRRTAAASVAAVALAGQLAALAS